MSFLLFLSDAMVPLMIFYIVGFGILSGRPVLDDFIRGVKDGVKTVGGIFPTLIGLMVSVGILRSSGLLDAFGELLRRRLPFWDCLMPLSPQRWYVWCQILRQQAWFWIFLRNTARSPEWD